ASTPASDARVSRTPPNASAVASPGSAMTALCSSMPGHSNLDLCSACWVRSGPYSWAEANRRLTASCDLQESLVTIATWRPEGADCVVSNIARLTISSRVNAWITPGVDAGCGGE